MRIVEITPTYSVSSQIAAADVAEIAALGYRSIMCNRPDGEDPGQTPVAEVRAEAERLGLGFGFVPVISGQVVNEAVAEFGETLAGLPAPVLAYCRSGSRCQTIWKLSQDPDGQTSLSR